jgi:xanthine dehydrogenase accessory factor
MNEAVFWKFILKTIRSEKKIVLLLVSESSNSSPGKQGFKMAVTEDAEMIGTVGGGIMEKDVIEYSLNLLIGKETKLIKKLHHSDKTNFEKSGLTCGGYQTIIFCILNKSQVQLIESILSSISQKQNGILSIIPGKIDYLQNEEIQHVTFHYRSDADWQYTETIGQPLIAYIAGGGHVGLAVSRVMKSLGFYVVIFDHRNDVFTIEQNEFADEIVICKYPEIGDKVAEGLSSYVIIVTPMHSGDKDTLKSVIHKNVKYIGMMGSKRKIKTIFEDLSKEGIDDKLFEKVHTPIGLEIEAESPEEIAVSIAAEIIKVKNN